MSTHVFLARGVCKQRRGRRKARYRYLAESRETALRGCFNFLESPESILPRAFTQENHQTTFLYLPQKKARLPKVKVRVIFRFMCDIGSEIAPDDAVPCRMEFLVEMCANVSSNFMLRFKLIYSNLCHFMRFLYKANVGYVSEKQRR